MDEQRGKCGQNNLNKEVLNTLVTNISTPLLQELK